MVQVTVLDDYHGAFAKSPDIAALRARADVTVWRDHLANYEALAERLAVSKIIVAIRERTRFPATLLERLPNLRFIAQSGNHAYHIDLAAATRLGIAVAVDPRPAAQTTGTAELTIGLILALLRGIPRYDAVLHAGGWEAPYGRVLAGKMLGIVGVGHVGADVARLAGAFQMHVLAWSPTLTPDRAAACGATLATNLDTLLGHADVVTIHVPLSPETTGLIDARRIALMRPEAVLVNTSRGAIIDEAALVDALRTRRIAGAALDVFIEEPPPPSHPLRACANVVLTPHAGWPTDQSYERFAASTTYLVQRYLDGKPVGVLNPEALRFAHRGRNSGP